MACPIPLLVAVHQRPKSNSNDQDGLVANPASSGVLAGSQGVGCYQGLEELPRSPGAPEHVAAQPAPTAVAGPVVEAGAMNLEEC